MKQRKAPQMRTLGDATNNVAEYAGVVEVLKHALRFHAAHLLFHVDSMLVAKQINCEWRCTCEALKHLYECALNLMSQLRSHPLTTAVSLRHVYR